jgi:hypothetical protein
MTTLATTIPGSSNNGYVAAAYIVFFAIVLIYVAIMALRLTRVERGLCELNERAGISAQDGRSGQADTRQDLTGQRETPDSHTSNDQTRARETV